MSASVAEPSFCRRVVSEREADRLVRSVSLLSAISSGGNHDSSPAAGLSSVMLHTHYSRHGKSRTPRHDESGGSGGPPTTTSNNERRSSPTGLLRLSHAPSVQASSQGASPPARRGTSGGIMVVPSLKQEILLSWRQRLPFVVPSQHPELMSYDPTMCHSAVRRLVRDSGLRAIYVPAVDALSHTDTLNLNVEKGVLGMSLRKHSEAFRMSRIDTYPGLVSSN